MKAAAFDYVRPQSLADAIGLLSNAGCDAQVMAGGQSLVPMMNLRLASPELVIDIGRLHELRATADAPDHVLLGACVTHAAIEDGAVPDSAHGLERTSARVLGCEIDGGEQAIAEDLNDRAFDDFQSALHKAMAICAVRQVLS